MINSQSSIKNSDTIAEIYRGVFENMIEGCCYCEMIFENGEPVDFVHLHFNKAFTEITGVKNPTGKRFSEFIPDFKKIDPDLLSTYKNLLKTGKPVRFERYNRAVGKWIRGSALKIDDIHFVVMIDDITIQKKRETLLIESENKFQTAFSDSPNIMLISSVDERKIIDVNEAFLKTTGYSKDDVIGRTVEEFGFFEFERDRIQLRAEVLVKGGVQGKELNFRMKSGEIRAGLISISLIRTREKQHILSSILDITDRKLIENTLRINEAKLTNALQIADLGYWEYDVINDLFTFNDQFYSIFSTSTKIVGGYTMPSARYAELFVHPDDRKLVGEEIKKALESTDPSFIGNVEHRIIFGDGETGYVSVRYFTVRDESGKVIRTFGANQNITERKNVEIIIRKTLNEKELLLKEVHHRVKNNLQVVASLLNMQSRYVNDEQSKKYFKLSADRVKAMALIHQQLYKELDISKINFQKYVKDLVKRLYKLYCLNLKNIDLTVNIGDISLGIDEAVPCGLLVNEIVTNSLIHAYI